MTLNLDNSLIVQNVVNLRTSASVHSLPIPEVKPDFLVLGLAGNFLPSSLYGAVLCICG